MPPVPSLPELAGLVAEIDRRLAALEKAVGEEAARSEELAEKDAARKVELSKLAWAAKHGRQRPW